MTIEQLAEQATDEENFSRDGEVVVALTSDGWPDQVAEDGTREQMVPITGASYNTETKQLILRVSRQEQRI